MKRVNHISAAPEAMGLLFQQEEYIEKQCSEHSGLLHLIKLRVSQINQCAFCIDMHTRQALDSGETLARLMGLNAWRDMPFYSQQETIVLDWAERLTQVESISDSVYQRAVNELGESLLVSLTLAVNAINSWNRMAKAFKPEVGSLS